jgi:hypothetical protein
MCINAIEFFGCQDARYLKRGERTRIDRVMQRELVEDERR